MEEKNRITYLEKPKLHIVRERSESKEPTISKAKSAQMGSGVWSSSEKKFKVKNALLLRS
ncbi:hypothetical protein TIFTF001_031330 [Ficus carica]|uniref:Uncharacterized protein n=1 Tax=Ficus carica TaxID=3494 RepID=A0AA88J5B1_FICCA|nr:hypothetical protein TIFTF001_031330 [Ficus carica]